MQRDKWVNLRSFGDGNDSLMQEWRNSRITHSFWLEQPSGDAAICGDGKGLVGKVN